MKEYESRVAFSFACLSSTETLFSEPGAFFDLVFKNKIRCKSLVMALTFTATLNCYLHTCSVSVRMIQHYYINYSHL